MNSCLSVYSDIFLISLSYSLFFYLFLYLSLSLYIYPCLINHKTVVFLVTSYGRGPHNHFPSSLPRSCLSRSRDQREFLFHCPSKRGHPPRYLYPPDISCRIVLCKPVSLLRMFKKKKNSRINSRS